MSEKLRKIFRSTSVGSLLDNENDAKGGRRKKSSKRKRTTKARSDSSVVRSGGGASSSAAAGAKNRRGSKSVSGAVSAASSVTSYFSDQRLRSSMKIASADDSLHTPYGSLMNLNAENEGRRSITFTDIEIRTYARTVGDNPSCSSGPPVTITWDYDPDVVIVDVDSYENQRPPRRSTFEMVLPRNVRQQMLKEEWQVTQSQIASAVRANIKIKNQRRATVHNLDKLGRMEELLESAGRKLKRGLFMKKRTSKIVAELDSQRERAMRYRASLSEYSQSRVGSHNAGDSVQF